MASDQPGTRNHGLFLNFPDEVILHMLGYMKLPSILSFRCTCSQIYRISQTKRLWLDIIRWLETLDLFPVFLERPIVSYSSYELESIVRRLARSEINWSRLWIYEPPIYHLPVAPGFVSYLIPGGRWFLRGTTDWTGQVLYYDLENFSTPGRLLLQVNGVHIPCIELTAEVHQTEASWSFSLAAVFRSAASIGSQMHRLAVATVTLSEDGQRLIASSMTEMTVHRNIHYERRHMMSLSEYYILRAVNHMESPSALYVYRWKGGTTEERRNPRVCLPESEYGPIISATLLPDRRMVVTFRQHICLYPPATVHYSALETSPAAGPVGRPLWVHELEEGWVPLNAMVLDSPSIYVSHRPGLHCINARYQGYIFYMQISNDASAAPEIFTVPIESVPDYAYLYHHACRGVAFNPGPVPASREILYTTVARREPLAEFHQFIGLNLTIVGSRAEKWHVSHVRRSLKLPRWWDDSNCFLDEQSGRIVFPPSDKYSMHIRVVCLGD